MFNFGKMIGSQKNFTVFCNQMFQTIIHFYHLIFSSFIKYMYIYFFQNCMVLSYLLIARKAKLEMSFSMWISKYHLQKFQSYESWKVQTTASQLLIWVTWKKLESQWHLRCYHHQAMGFIFLTPTGEAESSHQLK